MAQFDRQQVAARLDTRQEEIERRREELHRNGDGLTDELADYDQHPADQGTETFEQELDETTLMILEEEEHRGREARKALDEGGYGICVDCGKEIPTKGLDYQAVECDVLDRRAVRRAMRDVDRVFHLAGLVSMRPTDDDRLFEVNVGGTRIVLEEALRAGVERVVYTSSVTAIGPAPPGETADERQLFTAGRLGIPYVNSKHEAEVEALRLAAQGLPVVVVNPCYVFGAGDIYAR